MRKMTNLMLSGDVELQLVLLDELARAVLALSGLFSGVLETEVEKFVKHKEIFYTVILKQRDPDCLFADNHRSHFNLKTAITTPGHVTAQFHRISGSVSSMPRAVAQGAKKLFD